MDKDTYPVANRAGAYTYEQTISWDELKSAVEEKHGVEEVELQRMVLYVHGVPDDTNLPASVRSPSGVPAPMTLPVACAEFDIQPTQH